MVSRPKARGLPEWQVQHFMFLGEEVIEVLSATEPRIVEVERTFEFRPEISVGKSPYHK